MFTPGGLIAGMLAAFIFGLSKTGLPGSTVAAIPLIALVFEGRQIPGATLPLLIVADIFAVAWYRHHARRDVLEGIAPWVAVGFACGISFFIMVGSASRLLEVTIGCIVLTIIAIQLFGMFSGSEPRTGRVAVAAYGTSGGFTTFVANAAGPVFNTYLAMRRLEKDELLGTAAWFYFSVNLLKIPFYLALGAWTTGGLFFSQETLLWDLAVIPGLFLGVFGGRVVASRIPQKTFLLAVLLLSAVGALVLIF